MIANPQTINKAHWGTVPLKDMSKRACEDVVKTINHSAFDKGTFTNPTKINDYSWAEWKSLLNARIFQINKQINIVKRTDYLLSSIGFMEKTFDKLVFKNSNIKY